MKAVRPADPSTPIATRLGALLAGSVVYRSIEIPRVGRADMRLMTHDEEEGVTIDVARFLAGGASGEAAAIAGIPAAAHGRRAVLSLAIAVRDPNDHAKPFGTVEEWGALDDSVIGPVWNSYSDLVEELDPMKNGEISDLDIAAITDLVKKKEWSLVPGYGLSKLIAWLRTTADQPAPSETPTS